MMSNSNKEVDQEESLQILAKPLIEYLNNNYHPHTAIIITDERVAVIDAVLSIPHAIID